MTNDNVRKEVRWSRDGVPGVPVRIAWTLAGVSAPVPRSTRKRWMPRPLPGGRSTWVGSTSRSGELNVPT